MVISSLESLGEIEQLDPPALVIQSDMAGNELAQAARIDVSDSREVQDDLISTSATKLRIAFFSATVLPPILMLPSMSRTVTSPIRRSWILRLLMLVLLALSYQAVNFR